MGGKEEEVEDVQHDDAQTRGPEQTVKYLVFLDLVEVGKKVGEADHEQETTEKRLEAVQNAQVKHFEQDVEDGNGDDGAHESDVAETTAEMAVNQLEDDVEGGEEADGDGREDGQGRTAEDTSSRRSRSRRKRPTT